MVYQSADKALECVRDVYHGAVNDVYICRDIKSKLKTFYTLWVIHDHDTTRKLLEIFETGRGRGCRACLESFSCENVFCMVFDYRQERRLADFYMGRTISLYECESVCMNLIMECIASDLPYPVLYLILAQEQLHIAKDKSIYFSYAVNLEQLNDRKKESDCALQCASILLRLLEPRKKAKAVSYKLLEMKIPKKCYAGFVDLYRDVKLAAVPQKKEKLKRRVYLFFRKNQNLFFRAMLVLCIVFGSAALIMIIMQGLFGDVPFYRLFVNPFKMIGTESLLQ